MVLVIPETSGLIVYRGRSVCDSLHRAVTFLDGFLRPVKIEQAKMGQSRRHDHIWRLARHAAARDPHLHNVDARGQHVEQGRRPPSRKRCVLSQPSRMTSSRTCAARSGSSYPVAHGSRVVSTVSLLVSTRLPPWSPDRT